MTIECSLLQEMKQIPDLETGRTKDEDRTLPVWSNTCEMICRRGVKAYKKENPHTSAP